MIITHYLESKRQVTMLVQPQLSELFGFSHALSQVPKQHRQLKRETKKFWFFYLYVVQVWDVLGTFLFPHPLPLSSFPLSLENLWNKQKNVQALLNGEATAQLQNWQRSKVASCTKEKGKRGGWGRGREGGVSRGRQSNQGLNLDTNLNRYCISQSARLSREKRAANPLLPKHGDSSFVSFLFVYISQFFPSYFYSVYSPSWWSPPPHPRIFLLCYIQLGYQKRGLFS